MPEYTRTQGIANVAPDGTLENLAVEALSYNFTSDLVDHIARLRTGSALVAAFEHQLVRRVVLVDDTGAHEAVLEPVRPLATPRPADVPAVRRDFLTRMRADLLAAFASTITEDDFDFELEMLESPEEESPLWFGGMAQWTQIDDLDALRRIASELAALNMPLVLTAYLGIDGGAVSVDGPNVEVIGLEPRPPEAWARISAATGRTNALELFGDLIRGASAG